MSLVTYVVLVIISIIVIFNLVGQSSSDVMIFISDVVILIIPSIQLGIFLGVLETLVEYAVLNKKS